MKEVLLLLLCGDPFFFFPLSHSTLTLIFQKIKEKTCTHASEIGYAN